MLGSNSRSGEKEKERYIFKVVFYSSTLSFKAKAEIYSYISRVETISYMESTLLGKVYFCYMYVLYILYMSTFNCNSFLYKYIYIYCAKKLGHRFLNIKSNNSNKLISVYICISQVIRLISSPTFLPSSRVFLQFHFSASSTGKN